MIRVMTALSGLLTVAALSGCSVNIGGILDGAQGHTASGNRSISVPHQAGAGMSVFTRNGTVEIVAEPARQDVGIDVTILCQGKTAAEASSRLENVQITTIRGPDGTLEIRAVFPEAPRSGDGASFAIKTPDASGVVIDTSNGWVKAEGLGGTLRIDTSNGAVHVADHAGDVVADSSNGNVTVGNVAGSLEVDTSNAVVTVASVDGAVDVKTSNGVVQVTLTEDQAGPVAVKSSNGAVLIQATSALAGGIELDTSNGRAEVIDQAGIATVTKTSKSSLTVSVGHTASGREPASRVKTSNADVQLEIGPR